ncbi:phage tail protein [Halomonas litopenaei]|uniref:Phage tail protein n=1 Tax=Halomonas litopenaei TaxID=2109328 RepID=A0ABX5IWB7_9GAMM|nr:MULTISPECIES: phage tail tube protein [Halomonas]PTL88863.1 phage tail protein [Halomonas sp. SYSU XM8]PTL93432.1 phage tail protein [Halomonas litopenaei]
MSVLAQGTHVYFIDPNDGTPQVVQVECATSFSPGGNPADQIEDTCLEDFERSYKPGLRTPGQASLGLNSDPTNASHVTLHELSQMNPSPTVKWAIGFSDGTDAPTLGVGDDFDLPETRTWFTFEGYVSDFPFDFSQNSLVTSEVSIQRSGGSTWIPKV